MNPNIKSIRYLVRFFPLFLLTTILFLLPLGATSDSVSLRWIQVDKGIPAYAYRAGAMMVQNDRISCIHQIYGALMFDGTSWQSTATPTTFPRSDYAGNMFLDSRGIIYIGGIRADYDGSNTPYSYIFESVDGLHYSPVQPFVDFSGRGIIWNFTEDKYGNVWAGEYTTHSATTGAHLWRRRPNGTWTNVANWATPEDHIHYTYYDPYRDALYVAIGDMDHGILKLPSEKINAEKISSSDFIFILPTFEDGTPVEVTALTSDASYLYVGMDMHSPYGTMTRAISRIVDDGVTQTIEAVYPLEGCAVWQWADVDDAGNVVFSSIGINEWSCTDNYVNQIVASSDQGDTWTIVKDFGHSSTSRGMAFTGLASHYALNWGGLYGGGNGWGGPAMRAIIGRVIPTDATFYIDSTTGIDWTNIGLSKTKPVKTFNYLELLDMQPGDTVQFVGSSTYTTPLIMGWGGNENKKISIRGNPTSTLLGGNVSNAPIFQETFEADKGSWIFALNESGGSITADTAIVHNGRQSAKIVRGETGLVSLQLKNVATTPVNEGDTLYLDYWVYYPTDQTSTSDQNMLRLLDDSNYEIRVMLFPERTSNLPNEIAINLPVWSSWYIPARQSLSSANWHKINMEVYLHSTTGSLKMYVDNSLWFNINGIQTVSAGGKLKDIFFYNFDNPITYYIDDFRYGKQPFDVSGAINSNGYSYLDINSLKFQGANGVIISNNTTDVNLHNSIFTGISADAIFNLGNTNINLYFNTIFTSGRYGIYSAGNATLKNNVIYDTTTNDIYIQSGTSLTGSNNWFQDSKKGGTGTYHNLGNTTWSGADPGFVDPGSGDFHLRSTSPLIDAGISVAGISFDFASTTRPYGLAPEIGAYEFFQYHQVFVPFVSVK